MLTYIINHFNNYFLVGLLFITIIIIGCSSEEATVQLSAEERFRLGMKAFNDEDYLDAIEEFKVITIQFQGSNVADSAQFYMAESRFLREEYILAAFEYDVLIRNMPSSVFISRARFAKATCYYNLSPKSYLDQNYTRKAIEDYQEFLEYHPSDSLASVAEARIKELNTKLAKKEYENGIIYMHMEYYKAATYYFDIVLEKYHDTQYAEPALLKKVEALIKRKKFPEARESLNKFFIKYPSSSLLADANRLKKDLETEEIAEKKAKEKEQKKVRLKEQQRIESEG